MKTNDKRTTGPTENKPDQAIGKKQDRMAIRQGLFLLFFSVLPAIIFGQTVNMPVTMVTEEIVEENRKRRADALQKELDELHDRKISDFDKVYFLLGTLDDYMGRSQTFEASTDSFRYERVDIYGQGEKYVLAMIDSLFRNEYPDMYVKSNGADKTMLYSSALSAVVNDYYNYEPTLRTIAGEPIYTGWLKECIFTDREQKMAYLAGAIFRYGRAPYDYDGKYTINCSNSLNVVKTCTRLLVDLGCPEVHYKTDTNYVPALYAVSFMPTPQLKVIIEKMFSYRHRAINQTIDHGNSLLPASDIGPSKFTDTH